MRPLKLWRCLTRQIFGLDEHLCWVWWRALGKSQWSEAKAWREAVIAFDRRPLHRQRPPDVEAFIHEWATPKQLMNLVEDLKTQRLLMPRDAARIEEAILTMLLPCGQWK
jgi:hypothetical protein